MTKDRKIDKQILIELQRNSEGDNAVSEFLTELYYEESKNTPKWRYTKFYQNKINKYTKEWSQKNENS